MASLYRDSKSPFWFLRFKDVHGKWRCRSLRPLRHGIATDTRKANEQCAQQALEEYSRSPQRDIWASWVPQYLRSRYLHPITLRRVLNGWNRISQYLIEKKLTAPQDVTYRACREYMPWRTPKAAHNTARFELKILGIVCDEAVRRGLIRLNPASKLGIPMVRGREKPELSDDDITKIRAALKTKPAWMSHAFEIALHTGCRLSETALFRTDVDLDAGNLHFRLTKGSKPFTVPLNPGLKPLFQKLLAGEQGSDDGSIFRLPVNATCHFHSFFEKLGIPGVTFHCTRVTVASRLARAGYPLAKALRLLNHSSELIHRQYQRLSAQDVADAYDVLKLPDDKPENETRGSFVAT